MHVSVVAPIENRHRSLAAIGLLAAAAEEIGYRSVWLIRTAPTDPGGLPEAATDPWMVAASIAASTERLGIVIAGAQPSDVADRLPTARALIGDRFRVVVAIHDAADATELATRLGDPSNLAMAVLVSGSGPDAVSAAALTADGWVSDLADAHDLGSRWQTICERAAEAGRRVEDLRLHIRVSVDATEQVGPLIASFGPHGVDEVVLDAGLGRSLDETLASYAAGFERIH